MSAPIIHRLLYRLGLLLYSVAIWMLAKLGKHRKAQLWLAGRAHFSQRLEAVPKDKPIIWMHVASLGEFEQGRPLIDALLKATDSYTLLVSFFSPSGYAHRKDYPGIVTCYLPLDSPKQAKRWIRSLPLALAVFIKYDFWYYYLKGLQKAAIPTLLVAASIHPRARLLRPYVKGFYRPIIHCFSHIFCQDPTTQELLKAQMGYTQTSVTGDPRFDSVWQKAQAQEPIPQISDFVAGRWTMVAGSTYAICERLIHNALQQYWPKDMCLTIAPHEVTTDRLAHIQRLWPAAVRYSAWKARTPESTTPDTPLPAVLIIDNVGMLNRLYAHARLSYVGGAWGGGDIHNVLESAVHGCFTTFGPRHHKFPEVAELIEHGGAAALHKPEELVEALRMAAAYTPSFQEKQKSAKEFVAAKTGSTQAFVNWLQENKLLTAKHGEASSL